MVLYYDGMMQNLDAVLGKLCWNSLPLEREEHPSRILKLKKNKKRCWLHDKKKAKARKAERIGGDFASLKFTDAKYGTFRST